MKNTYSFLPFILLAVCFGYFSFYSPAFASATAMSCTSISSNLKIGQRDSINKKDVSSLQLFLASQGYLNLGVTGIPTGYFGSITEKAVKNFQTKEKISATGFVGQLTRTKIKDISCAQTPVTTNTPETTQTTSEVKPALSATVSTPDINISLPYTSTNFSDWTLAWGDVSTTTGKLKLSANGTPDARAVLKNSSELTDYVVSVNSFVRQGVISILARYVNSDNYLSCVFYGKSIELVQVVDGDRQVVAQTYMDDVIYSRFFYNDLNLKMSVKGKIAGCTILGNTDNVTFSNINDKLSKGGVAMHLWNDTMGLVGFDINSIQISKN